MIEPSQKISILRLKANTACAVIIKTITAHAVFAPRILEQGLNVSRTTVCYKNFDTSLESLVFIKCESAGVSFELVTKTVTMVARTMRGLCAVANSFVMRLIQKS